MTVPAIGEIDGDCVGCIVVGERVGVSVVGANDGVIDGVWLGRKVGGLVGIFEGLELGNSAGEADGSRYQG